MASNTRYKKVVVPIDGSGWSERAIPHAVDIARAHDAEIILLHVFRPPVHEYTDQIALAGQQEQLDQIRENVKTHLMSVRNTLRNEQLNVRVQMIEGTGVASLICDYVNEEDADLVVMCTHGRGGLARFMFGSVAHKVMQEVRVPVLLIRPDKDNPDDN